MKTYLYRNLALLVVVLALLAGMPYLGQAAPPSQESTGPTQARDDKDPYEIKLKSRQFIPDSGAEIRAMAIEGERGHVILQFHDIPTEEERAALAAAGIKLLDYIPNKAWFASIPADLDLDAQEMADLRWMGAISPSDKSNQSLAAGRPGSWAVEADGRVRLNVLYFPDTNLDKAKQIVGRHRGEVLSAAQELDYLTAKLPPEEIHPLAAEDGIQWLEEVPPPPAVDNDGIRARINVNSIHIAPYGLSGAGVDVGIWDEGQVDNHTDFSGRLTVVETAAGVSNHATHVAGTMAGSGALSGGTYKGMAPATKIYSYDFYGNTISEHNLAANTYGVEISQNSWGACIGPIPYGGCPSLDNCDYYGDYDIWARDYDKIVTGLYVKKIPVVFSAGNERNDGDCQMGSGYFYENVTPPATGKNTIVIGATNSDDDSMTTFSSWGPVDDGRIKPDVVAPGCETAGSIWSTLPGNTYGGACGTSMAAPAVSGIAALLIEQYREAFNTPGEPFPSTIKALLIHGAKDLGNPGPDYQFGYGRVDAQASADLIRDRDFREESVGHKQEDAFSIYVPPATPSLKVTLVWDDPAGAVNADPALVNDLDLLLTPPGGSPQYLTWVLDPDNPSNPATKTWDGINNVEQAQIVTPMSGNWTVHVHGWNVPQGPQVYSLVTERFVNAPVINSLSPGCGATPGNSLTIKGSAFGKTQSGGTVKFPGGVNGTVTSWNATEIAVTVPAGAQSGELTVTTSEGTSNGIQFNNDGQCRTQLPIILKDYCARPVLYFDDFSDPSSGWPVAEYDCCKFEYLGGEYRILLKLPGWITYPNPNRSFSNFMLEADGRYSTDATGAYGLLFGMNSDWTQWYVFRIGTTNYSIYRFDNGNWYDLQPWTYSPHIKTGTASNHLKVIRDGSRIEAYVNGHYLTTVTDSTYTGTRGVGLFARTWSDGDANVDARFDDFKVTSLTCGTAGSTFTVSGGKSAVGGTDISRLDIEDSAPVR